MEKNDCSKMILKGNIKQDLILYNGTIITLDSSSRIAEAIAVRDGSIVAVGASAELLANASPETQLIDLRGRTLVPGFFDAHPHMDREGLKQRGGISIAGLCSVAGIVNAVRNAVRSTKPGEWILLMPMQMPGREYPYMNRPEQLSEGRFPTRYDLDDVAPNNPVYIRAVWGYWSRRPFPSVANSMALNLAGVTRDTPAPLNTEIVKDARGEPTGVFLEWNFMPVLEYTLFKILPRFTYADRVESVRLGCAAYSAVGTTSGYEGHGLTPSIIRAYREVRERGELTVRIHAPYSMATAAMEDRKISDLLYHYAGLASGRGSVDDTFRVEGVMLGNGNNDPKVVELIAREYPYEQWAGFFAQSLPPNDTFVRLAIEAGHLDLRVSHMCSRNIEEELNAYEAIDKKVSIRDRRWVLMHVMQTTPEQLKRIKALGLIVETIPTAMYMASDRPSRLDKLGDKGIPIRQMIDAGIPVTLGSDGTPNSMLWAIWEAVARWDEDSKSRLGDSRLTREEAMRLIQNGHMIMWNEDRFGSLEVGKMADLVVLGDNPLTCPEERIKDIPVDLTIVGGKIVYERITGE